MFYFNLKTELIPSLLLSFLWVHLYRRAVFGPGNELWSKWQFEKFDNFSEFGNVIRQPSPLPPLITREGHYDELHTRIDMWLNPKFVLNCTYRCYFYWVKYSMIGDLMLPVKSLICVKCADIWVVAHIFTFSVPLPEAIVHKCSV